MLFFTSLQPIEISDLEQYLPMPSKFLPPKYMTVHLGKRFQERVELVYDGFRVLPSRFWCTFTCSISTPQSSKKSYQFSFSKIKPSSGSSQIVVDFTKQKRCFGIKIRISFTKNKIAGTMKPNQCRAMCYFFIICFCLSTQIDGESAK